MRELSAEQYELIASIGPESAQLVEDDFPLAEVYDRITVEGNYFDYAEFASAITETTGSSAEILELCVGTGNLATELANTGHSVTGIDVDQKMLNICAEKVAGLDVELNHQNAADFSVGKKFDAVVIHSGHIIINRRDEMLFLNTSDPDLIEPTLERAFEHLKPGGHLIINIEEWEDLVFTFPDGSVYARMILEDTDLYGSRMHIFYDRQSERKYAEPVYKQPKVAYKDFKRSLRDAGFSQIEAVDRLIAT